MEPAPNTPPAAPPLPSLLTTWPRSVQLALGVILVAGLFFLLGRWSNPQPALAERSGPALDLNRATRAELRLLPGVGDALAQRIVDHRQRNGVFRSVEELRQVSGFGPKTLDRLRPVLFVDADEPIVMSESSAMPTAAAKPKAPSVSKKATDLTQPINVNHANQAELQKLPGIGPKLSQRILDERAKARFKSIEDLRRVPGIGAKTLEKLRPFVAVEEVRTVASVDGE